MAVAPVAATVRGRPPTRPPGDGGGHVPVGGWRAGTRGGGDGDGGGGRGSSSAGGATRQRRPSPTVALHADWLASQCLAWRWERSGLAKCPPGTAAHSSGGRPPLRPRLAPLAKTRRGADHRLQPSWARRALPGPPLVLRGEGRPIFHPQQDSCGNKYLSAPRPVPTPASLSGHCSSANPERS